MIYKLFDILNSDMFNTVIRQRMVNGRYEGLGLCKLQMNKLRYSVLVSSKINGELSTAVRDGVGVVVVEGDDQRSIQTIDEIK